jgi:hypothetical protein
MQSIAEINKTQQKNDVTRSDYTLAIVGKKKEKKQTSIKSPDTPMAGARDSSTWGEEKKRGEPESQAI